MTIKQTQPLYTLLHDIGEAVACLNTCVVGLDAVEKGHEKPDSLDISWAPDDRGAAARKARKFVLEAVLVRVSEAVLEHAIAISRMSRFSQATAAWNSNTKSATKVWDVYRTVLEDSYLVAAAVLLVHWRNRIVHRNSRAQLRHEEKKLLRRDEETISDKYKSLSIDRLFSHFEEGRPTLKDVSSLISKAINLGRYIDGGLHDMLDKEDLDALLLHYGLIEAIAKVKVETKPEKLVSSLKRLIESRASMLIEAYEKHYLTSISISRNCVGV